MLEKALCNNRQEASNYYAIRLFQPVYTLHSEPVTKKVIEEGIEVVTASEYTWWSSGLMHHAEFWLCDIVSEKHTASIFRNED
jgi:phosphoribosyl-ATP pyrophosphohydrolase